MPSIIADNQPTRIVKYTTKDAPTLARFHAGLGFVRGVKGPIGSGKSTACCVEIITSIIGNESNVVLSSYIRYHKTAIVFACVCDQAQC